MRSRTTSSSPTPSTAREHARASVVVDQRRGLVVVLAQALRDRLGLIVGALIERRAAVVARRRRCLGGVNFTWYDGAVLRARQPPAEPLDELASGT